MQFMAVGEIITDQKLDFVILPKIASIVKMITNMSQYIILIFLFLQYLICQELF